MRQTGMGLVEVMVAAGLLALSVVLSERLLLSARRSVYNAQAYQSVQILGQSLLALSHAGRSDWLENAFSLQLSSNDYCDACVSSPRLSRDLSRWLQQLRSQGRNNPLLAHALACLSNHSGQLRLTLIWPDRPQLVATDCSSQTDYHRVHWEVALMG